MELIGFYLVGCALLVAAGVAKVARPDPAARALLAIVGARSRVPLRTCRALVRLGSVGEAALGAIALMMPRGATAWLVAATYLGFAVVILVFRSRGDAIASCGCFGTPDTPATLLHALTDVGLGLSAVSVAVAAPTGSIVSLLGSQPLGGLPLLAAAALCAWLTHLVTSTLAQVEGARRALGIERHDGRRA